MLFFMLVTIAIERRAGERALLPRRTHRYKLSSSFRKSSFVLPSFCSNRPSNSSSFPSAKVRSSSVNCAYFCLSFPFSSFQLPLNCRFVIVIEVSRARRRSVVLRSGAPCASSRPEKALARRDDGSHVSANRRTRASWRGFAAVEIMKRSNRLTGYFHKRGSREFRLPDETKNNGPGPCEPCFS
jgi:hypothetical protein